MTISSTKRGDNITEVGGRELTDEEVPAIPVILSMQQFSELTTLLTAILAELKATNRSRDLLPIE